MSRRASASSDQGRDVAQRDMAAMALVACFAVACGTCYAWIVTHGTFLFVGREPYWQVFPEMWRSLTHGRFDVPYDVLRDEAFIRAGKAYTYFGIFPALVRGAASVIADPSRPGLPQASCALAATTAVLALAGVGASARLHAGRSAPWFALLLLTASLATPLLYGLSLADIYDETILWGAAWASIFQAAHLQFALSRSRGRRSDSALPVMAVAAGFAVLSRLTEGLCLAVELAAVLLWVAIDAMRGSPVGKGLRVLLARRSWTGALVIWLFFLAAQGAVNYGRFGMALAPKPMQFHESWVGKERGRLGTLYGGFGLDHVATSACIYFLPDPGNVMGHWPFIVPGGRRCFRSDAQYEQIRTGRWMVNGDQIHPPLSPYYDRIEGPRVPLPIASPALVLFAIAGAFRVRFRGKLSETDRAGIILLGSAILMCSLLLTYEAVTLRYQIDLTPWLSALGLFSLMPQTADAAPRTRWRNAVLGGMALVVVWSVGASAITLLIVKANKPNVPGNVRASIVDRLNG